MHFITTSFGHQIDDLSGQQFGLWTVLSYSHTTRTTRKQEAKPKGAKHYWLCKCLCGATKVQESFALRSGRTRACRKCSARHLAAPKISKHNASNSQLYKTWSAIKQRCYNPKFESGYRYHGALGVTMHEPWRHDFMAFARYLGERPSPNHSVDRYPNPSGNYEPGNIRWATHAEQIHNRRKRA